MRNHIWIIGIVGAAALLFIAALAFPTCFPQAVPVIVGVLEWMCPLAFASAVLMVVIAGVFCRREIVEMFSRLKGRPARWLVSICASAMIVRLLAIPATHRIYYDEHTYLQIAKGIAEEGCARVAGWGQISGNRYHCISGSYPHWAVGWPALLGGVMRLTGYAPWVASWVNLVLSIIGVILMALLAMELSGRAEVAIAAAAIFAAIPANQVWSRTNASEVFAVTAGAFSVLSGVRFSRDGRLWWATLSAAALVVAVMARNESIILCLVCAALLGSVGRPGLRPLAAWTSVTLLWLVPQALHLGLVSRAYDPHLTEGSGFALAYLVPNLQSILDYLRHEPVACLAIILSPLGLVRSLLGRASLVVGLWGLQAFLLPMFYFAGAYHYPGGDRFLLACLPAVALGAGAVLWRVHGVLSHHARPALLATFWLAVFAIALLRAPAYAAAQDEKTRVPRADCAFLRMALRLAPEGAMVLTADPPAILAEGRSAFFLPWAQRQMDYIEALAEPGGQGLYMYISPSSSPAYWPDGDQALAAIRQSFEMTLLTEEWDVEGRREFYKLGPRETPAEPSSQRDSSPM